MSGAKSFVKNPVKGLVDTFTPITATTGLIAGAREVDDRTDISGNVAAAFGGETRADKEADAQKNLEKAANAEETARAQAYQDALNAKDIDAISRREILDLYSSGATSSQVGTALTRAKSGKGIYAVRRINENQQNLSADMPGRRQTLGGGTSLI
jgi:hypothetical protein